MSIGVETIELIDIEGSRREILEAFWKSPYLYVMYCIDLKIGTWPHLRKRNIITREKHLKTGYEKDGIAKR